MKVKPYACPIDGCGQSFARQAKLEFHLKQHEGKKEFICPYPMCKKAFALKGNLKTHLRIHTGEKPYHCTVANCTKSFAYQSLLNDHMAKRHKVTKMSEHSGVYSLKKPIETRKSEKKNKKIQ